MKKKTNQKNRKKKRSIIKIIFGIILIFVIVFIAGVILVLTNIDKAVTIAIEKYGSKAIHTDVQVDKVQFKLKEGAASLKGLTVANPKGFDDTHPAFSLGEISTKVNLKSLAEDVKIIDDINIDAPKIYMEVNKDNKNNLNEIKKKIPESPKGKENTKKRDTEEIKMIIRRLRFADGDILAKIVPQKNKEYKLKLHSFEMRDLGGKNGATPQEIAKQVLKEITSRSLGELKKKGIGQGISEIKDIAKSKFNSW
jgi:hypothetical protein